MRDVAAEGPIVRRVLIAIALTFGGIVLVLGSALIWATGSFLSSRLPLPPDALVATAIEMLAGGAGADMMREA